MTIQIESTKRTNNFGTLRLFFATLVIVSHSPELIDGNRARELLTRLFGSMSFGEVAVDGFFLVSGYLITMSFTRSRTTLSYLTKRFGRIVPGYIVAFLICFFVIAPIVGATVSPYSFSGLKGAASQILRLLPPDLPGTFSGLPYPHLNGAMWTIAYEFRCYVLVAICGLVAPHVKGGKILLATLVAICLVLSAFGRLASLQFPILGSILGAPYYDLRFFATFGVGSLFYVFRERITFTPLGCLAATAVLLPAMFSHHAAERAFVVCGGYLIFAVALRAPNAPLFAWTNRTDISYGLYLYAWPIQNLIIWSSPGVSPWALCAETTLLAALAGYASWILIEKPCLTFAHRRSLISVRATLPEAA